MSDREDPVALSDTDLDIAGGVYVQEHPSGIKPKRESDGWILLLDEADAARSRLDNNAVFEPNDEK